jgi:hypothetical protein
MLLVNLTKEWKSKLKNHIYLVVINSQLMFIYTNQYRSVVSQVIQSWQFRIIIIVRFTQTGIHNLQYSIIIQNVMVDTIIIIRTQILVIFFNCIYCKERNNGWIYNPRYTCGVTIEKQSFFCLYRRILDKNLAFFSSFEIDAIERMNKLLSKIVMFCNWRNKKYKQIVKRDFQVLKLTQ